MVEKEIRELLKLESVESKKFFVQMRNQAKLSQPYGLAYWI
jgi:hypothetical protein